MKFYEILLADKSVNNKELFKEILKKIGYNNKSITNIFKKSKQ